MRQGKFSEYTVKLLNFLFKIDNEVLIVSANWSIQFYQIVLKISRALSDNDGQNDENCEPSQSSKKVKPSLVGWSR